VECVHELEGWVDGSGPGIGQLRPHTLRISLDQRGVFGQGELEPYVRIHVIVGVMVNHLPDGPASLAVRRIQLLGAEPGDRITQRSRRAGDQSNPSRAIGGSGLGGPLKSTDGIALVFDDITHETMIADIRRSVPFGIYFRSRR